MVPGGGGEGGDVLSSALAGELLGARLIASLATHDRDGGIHLVAMWFLWHHSAILIPTSGKTRKTRNIRREPRATVMIDDSRGALDLRGISIDCRADLIEGPEAKDLNRRIHLKYLTTPERDLAEVDGYLGTDDVTIRLVPLKAWTWDLRAGPGAALNGGVSWREGYYGAH